MNTRFLFATASCGLLTNCGISIPRTGADILTAEAQGEIPGSWSGSHRKGNVTPGWIRSFGDPTLTAIVDDAIARNPDLKAAAYRVEASRSAVKVASAKLYPRVASKGLLERQGQELSGDLNAGIDPPDLGDGGVDNSGGSGSSRSVSSSSQSWIYGLGIGAAWEADVWGRVRSGKAAAESESGALEADYEFARQSLAASVARAYFSAIEAAQQAANAQETLNLYQDYMKLTDVLKQQGFASDYEMAQIKSRTASAKDLLYSAQAAHAQAIRAIEVVTSHYPGGNMDTRNTFPSQPKSVPAGLPSQILERRPDIIAAERRFAAAVHRENEARTARLPRFALSATGGLGTNQLNAVGTLDGFTWSLASGVTQPIFFGGELKAAQEIRNAEQKAAAHKYGSTVLRAFQEVEDALAADHYLKKREGALEEMVSSSADTVKFGRMRLDEGQEQMFTILRLSGETLAAKVELTQLRASRLRERVNLHLALGGDFKGTGMVK